MSQLAERINADIAAASPALAAALSPLGRRCAFPPDIPFQAAQARDKAFNGTIGQITDGAGHAIPVAPLAAALDGLGEEERNRALLYSPVEGIGELRRRWRRWQRRGVDDQVPSTLPLVTLGLTHGLSLVADLFAGEGRTVLVPAPFWGNYRQIFGNRTGARIHPVAAYAGDGFDPEAIARAAAELPAGEPALALLNLPSNPGGYSPTAEERRRLRRSLAAAAEARPLLVVCDDAYAGLVYEQEIPRASMFWELAGVHPDLVPIKVDGATKELSFFGGRVGFLSFPFAADSAIAAALESKVKNLVRATVGSPSATTQMVVLRALESPRIEAEVEGLRRLLEGRYRALATALAAADRELLRPLPFNAGCFALVELPPGLDAEAVRRHLLEHESTGLISIPPRHLRIAHCSVDAAVLPELVRRLERGVREMAAAGALAQPSA